ncbi:MAG: DUF2520 domain-containing protein [Firmicutes bacterium]|nr:DUF2520 domain-containing protein [Bacillota bacterium]
MRIVIVGAGNVGTALAILLQRAGHEIVGLTCRTKASAKAAAAHVQVPYGTDPLEFTPHAELVFITTPDRSIAEVCGKIAGKKGFAPGTVVAHTSGAHNSQILNPVIPLGAFPLSFHPLQTFAHPLAGAENLPGSYITVEGHKQALGVGRQLVKDLQCKLLEISTESKPLYHCAAAIACNYFTAVIDAALQVMEASGIKRQEALPALYPLIAGTLQNIRKTGTTGALTGPVARGDVGTVETHLAALAAKIPHLLPLYATLGEVAVDIAARKGTLDALGQEQFLKLFGEVKK